MNEMAVEATLDLGDYLSAFKRRRLMIILVAVPVFIIGLIVAYSLPPTYESSSTILIERQEIPVDLVRTTVTTYAAQTIQTINQRVMTRSNLLEIMDKYDLFKKERKRKVMEEILADMRENIKIDMITAQVMDPRTGSPGMATIAFKVGFQGESPVVVQKVANELTTLYLNENLRSRTEKAQATYDFLTAEANRLNKTIQDLDKKLSDFKKLNINLLPESRSVTATQIQRTEAEIEQIDTQVLGAKESTTYLEGQLALLEPHGADEETVMSPAKRLQMLHLQHSSLSSQYSPDHPDILRLRREIDVLERETGFIDTTASQIAQLDELREVLSKLEPAYSAEHPDIKTLRREIAALEENIQAEKPPATNRADNLQPTNPAYITLANQIETGKIRIRLLGVQKAKLKEKLAKYEDRLMQMPRVEGEYRAMQRNYSNASSRLQDIKAKQTTAGIAQELEKERKGEKFTLIDPAVRPEKPISPNRPAIIFLSLILSLGAGIGLAVVTESMNSAVRGAKGIIAIVHTAPLAVIPYLANAAEISRKRKKRIITIALVILSIIAVILLVHFLFSPLDVLWFRALRKADNIVGE
jgi:succinoglycan biosynthesis transport protein ExoP